MKFPPIFSLLGISQLTACCFCIGAFEGFMNDSFAGFMTSRQNICQVVQKVFLLLNFNLNALSYFSKALACLSLSAM